ncbi:MAG: hypothetical protein KDK90_21600, partial [Leptospiraceae bacterium]|nr:hypothetical protein [Leptospiraceae bacterium]
MIKNETFVERSVLPLELPSLKVEKDGSLGASMPIALPPGNMVPQLSLVYTGREALVGDNWTITGIEFIARQGEGGIPFQNNSYYLSSMAGVMASSDGTTYHPITESFMKFTKDTSGEWTAKDKQGNTYTFGKKIATTSKDGISGNPVKLWVLTKVSGIIPANSYEITYHADSDTEGYPYPDKMIYNNNGETNRTVVQFEYEDNGHLVPVFTHGAYGRVKKRISAIKIQNKDTVIDTYRFAYTGNTLQSVTREGYKPITFTYTNRTIEEKDFKSGLSKEFLGSNFMYYAQEETFASGFGERANCSAGENFCVQTAWPGMNEEIKNLFSIQCAIFYTKYKNMCGKGIERSIQFFADVYGDANPEFIRVIGEQNQHKIKANNLGNPEDTIESDIFQLSKRGSIIPADIDTNLKIDFFILEDEDRHLKIGISKSDKIEVKETGLILKSIKTEEKDYRSFHFVLDYDGDGLVDFLQADGTKDDRRWYDLFVEVATNATEKQTHTETFQNQLTLKGNKHGVLALNVTNGNLVPMVTTDGTMIMVDGDWIVFGYNDAGEFKEVKLDMLQDTTLIQELVKPTDRRDKGMILSLSTSKLGHTANTNIDLDIQGISFYKTSMDGNGNVSFAKGKWIGVMEHLAGDYGVRFQQFKDMDNNGTPDFVRINKNNQMLITYFDAYWNPTSTVTANIDDVGTDGNTFFADINGDGYDDFVVLSATKQGDTIVGTSLKYYFFNGRDNFYYAGENQISQTHYSEQTKDKQNAPKSYEQQVLEAKFTEAYPLALAKFVYGDNPSPEQQAYLMNVKEMADTLLKDPKCDPYLYQCDESLAGKEGYEAWKYSKTFADVNGDGMPDFVRYYGDRVYISYFNPTGGPSGYYSAGGDISFPAEAFTQVLDVNGDGNPDFVGLKADFREYATRETDTAFSYNVSGRSGNVTLVTYTTPKGQHNLLSTVTDGLKSSSIQYGSSTTTANVTYPILPLTYPDVVVGSITTVLGGGYQEVNQYKYFDKLFFNGGGDTSLSKMLGLGKVEKIKTLISPTETLAVKESIYYNQYDLNSDGSIDVDSAGSVSKTEKTYPNKTDIMLETVFEYGKKDLYSGGTMVVNTKTTTKQMDGVASEEVKTRDYDLYGNVTSEVVETTGKKVTTLHTYNIDTDTWILDRAKTTEKKVNGITVELKDITYTNNVVTELKSLVAIKNGQKIWKTVKLKNHDGWGNPLVLEDSLGKTTTFTYDDFTHNLVTSQTIGGKPLIKKTYDYKTGNVLTEETPDGTVVNEYDFYGRLVKMKNPWHSGENDWSEKYSYYQDSSGNSRVTKYVYNGKDEGIWIKQYSDVLSREYKKESKVFSTEGKSVATVEDTSFDIQGRVIKKTKPYLSSSSSIRFSSFYYEDTFGRITKAINPDGKEALTTYDGYNQTLTIQATGTDGQSQVLNTVKVEKNPSTHTMSKTINGTKIDIEENINSNGYRYVLTKTEAGSEISYELYDLSGNKVLHRDRNSGTTTWNYDQENRLLSRTNANGKTVSYEYDGFDRVKKIKNPEGEGDILIVYGEDGTAPKPTKIIVKDIDEILGERDLYVTYLYYDKYGRVDYAKKVIDDLVLFFKYHYDKAGQLVATTYPNGITVRNEYAESGHLYRVTMEKGNDIDNEVLHYGIDPEQNLLYRVTGNKVVTTVSYDPLTHRPLQMKTDLENGRTAQNWTYTYD